MSNVMTTSVTTMQIFNKLSKFESYKILFKRSYDIEDIYFFQVNTKYISSSVLKHQNFHDCAARVKILMFSTHEMKYIGI